MRRVRIANLPPEVSDRDLRVALGKWGSMGHTEGKLVTCLPVYNGQRHQNSDVNLITTYPVAHCRDGASGFDNVRGAAHGMLWLQRNWTPVSSVAESEEGERIRKDNYHDIMG